MIMEEFIPTPKLVSGRSSNLITPIWKKTKSEEYQHIKRMKKRKSLQILSFMLRTCFITLTIKRVKIIAMVKYMNNKNFSTTQYGYYNFGPSLQYWLQDPIGGK